MKEDFANAACSEGQIISTSATKKDPGTQNKTGKVAIRGNNLARRYAYVVHVKE